MKARQRLAKGFVAIGAIALILATSSYAQQPDPGADSNPTSLPRPGVIPGPGTRPGPSSDAIDPLPPPGPPPQNWVYFTPQDENTSATVIFLVNSASWTGAILINFTTFSAYGKIGLPPGVTIDGYVVWDTSGIYDPLTSLQTLPLRFSTSDGRAF